MNSAPTIQDLELHFGEALFGEDRPDNTISAIADPTQPDTYIGVLGIREDAAYYLHFPISLDLKRITRTDDRDARIQPSQPADHIAGLPTPDSFIRQDRMEARAASEARSGTPNSPQTEDLSPTAQRVLLAAELEQIRVHLRDNTPDTDLARKALSLAAQLSQINPLPSEILPASRPSTASLLLRTLVDSTWTESHEVLFRAELERSRRRTPRLPGGKDHNAHIFRTPNFDIHRPSRLSR
jgi:hypothetical protein